LSKLREYRKNSGFTQEEFAEKLKENRATYQTYESGRTEIPIDVQNKLRKMGYTGPWPQEEKGSGYGAVPESQRSALTPAQQYVQSRIEQAVPRTLPEHTMQAWKLVKEVVLRGGGDLNVMDDDKIGLAIGFVAQEIALGRSISESRQELLDQAGVVVGIKAQP
jgi:transcriptional regulator with XRE-family HTH domain